MRGREEEMLWIMLMSQKIKMSLEASIQAYKVYYIFIHIHDHPRKLVGKEEGLSPKVVVDPQRQLRGNKLGLVFFNKRQSPLDGLLSVLWIRHD
jgi:hypothetical protein